MEGTEEEAQNRKSGNEQRVKTRTDRTNREERGTYSSKSLTDRHR